MPRRSPASIGQIAALLGTDVREITITDLVVHPKTKNAFLSVMRGQGTNARPVLLRVDGAGKIEVVAFDKIKYSKVDLPNAPGANEANPARNPRTSSITDMAFVDGRLFVAGLVERRVLLEAALGGLSVLDRRWRHQRRDLSRQSRCVRDALAGLHLRAVSCERRDEPHRRISLHAAGEVPGQQPAERREGAGHDDRRARQSQPSARHDRLQEGRQGIPAHVEQQPWRHEDPRPTRSATHRRSRRAWPRRPAACRSRPSPR